MTPATPQKKQPPAYLFALGAYGLPDTIVSERQGHPQRFRLIEVFKHDFFAATGLYEEQPAGTAGISADFVPREVVLKIQRTYPLFGLPMKWLGRRVARREAEILEALQGIPGVPEYMGTCGETGFLHAFIPGAPMDAGMPFTPEFFEQLRQLFAAIHERHIAYVDANKRENILFGTDGRPWLIDFQISYWAKKGGRSNAIIKWWLRRFQRADWYHFYKHKTRLLPEACTPEDFVRANSRGWLHSLHRTLTRPLIRMRRRFLSQYQLEKTK